VTARDTSFNATMAYGRLMGYDEDEYVMAPMNEHPGRILRKMIVA
jgi:hypothetical protein